MKVIAYLIRFAGWRFFLAAGFSLLAGACGSLVIKEINDAIHHGIENFNSFYLIVFSGLAAFATLSLIATKMLHEIIQKLVAFLSQDIGEKLLKNPYNTIENKEDKLFTVLTYDIYTISNVVEKIPNLFVSIAVVTGCLAYLIFLSIKMSLFIICILLMVFILLKVVNKRLIYLSNRSRILYDTYAEKTNSLIYGIKELYQNLQHRKHFLEDEYKEVLDKRRQNKVKEKVAMQFSGKLSEIILLFGIALVLGYTLYFSPENHEKFSEIFTLFLFIVGPLNNIAGFSKGLKPFNASINQIDNLRLELVKTIQKKEPTSLLSSFSIEVKDVSFSYAGEHHSFAIGPINMLVKEGTVNFITGGNGSGKTTLAKVLSGLYTPTKGEIICDQQLVTDDLYEEYRNLFSVIWNDNYVFEDIKYTNWSSSLAEELLNKTELDKKTKILKGVYSNTKLSSGQRKRLSLITSLLEEKKIYLFDEWAANQDIEFKDYFYNEVLQDLKKQGKTVIVISHDKNYFHLADQLFELSNGKLSKSA